MYKRLFFRQNCPQKRRKRPPHKGKATKMKFLFPHFAKAVDKLQIIM